MAVALDDSGNAYVTGKTESPNFPITVGALEQTYGRGSSFGDAFTVRVSADGTRLASVTFLGGSGENEGRAIAVDHADNTYLAGTCDSGLL